MTQLSELAPSELEITESVFVCYQKVGHDIQSSKIHIDFCHLVQKRVKANLEITVEQAMFELGHIPQTSDSRVRAGNQLKHSSLAEEKSWNHPSSPQKFIKYESLIGLRN